jgi:hypothetical protein
MALCGATAKAEQEDERDLQDFAAAGRRQGGGDPHKKMKKCKKIDSDSTLKW